MISKEPKPEIRTVIVDDENLARKNLKELLRDHPYVHVVGEAGNAAAGRDLIVETRPDLVFLDVRMPEGSGFDLLDRVEDAPSIIFVTAYDEFAVRAFENNAFDYLLKPLDSDRLCRSLERFLSVPRNRTEPMDMSRGERVCLNAGNKVAFISVVDIVAIMADKNYIRVFTVNGDCFVVRSALKDWRERFPSDIFMTLDRSLMINKHHVRLLTKKNRNGDVFMESIEKPFHLGRIALQRFKELMGVNEKQGLQEMPRENPRNGR
ncbi:MAG: response regulator [Syntrophorhabdaceae bacterium]|nr:response regulator [Syntrophorhabdaceae bacterium]